MCGPASGWSKLALIILLVSLPFHIAGWATTNWMTYTVTNGDIEMDVGLWRMQTCIQGACDESAVDTEYETDAFNAVRAFETITFCVVVFTIILLIIYVCAQMDKRQTFAAIIMFLCYFAGLCSFIGMIVFITTIPEPFEVSFSLGLTVLAMTLILIAGTLMIPDSFEPDYDDDEDDYYNPRRRSVVTPASLRRMPTSRGVTPISYKGGIEGSRWRSY